MNKEQAKAEFRFFQGRLAHLNDRLITPEKGEDELVAIIESGVLDDELNEWAPQVPYAESVTRRSKQQSGHEA